MTKDQNGLKAIRDMIKHFDDNAAGKGHGPAPRDGELDLRLTVMRIRYIIESASTCDAAIRLRSGAKQVSDAFIAWLKAS